MAPSRGFNYLLRVHFSCNTLKIRRYSDFVRAATIPSSRAQIYISRSLNPYLNLSIEHYLLQRTAPDATVLFLYKNRKCVVIGRNQNPWIETHIPSIKQDWDTWLVRRRSGGGTVFHDEGNVNYSVICPTSAFDRDKHAEMVVRALRTLGVERARVNERHDIVMDRIGTNNDNTRPLKVSGSAYKLTRQKAVHHGTCLLSSPNLKNISQILWSPSKQYINARGVESVSSPVSNVNVCNQAFEEAVVSKFNDLYQAGKPMLLTDSVKEVPEIAKGVEELMSRDWIYSQTPQFTFSTHHSRHDVAQDVRKGPWEHLLPNLPANFSANLTVRYGKIIKADIKFNGTTLAEEERINQTLLNKAIHEIDDWGNLLRPKGWGVGAALWMNIMLGVSGGGCGGFTSMMIAVARAWPLIAARDGLVQVRPGYDTQ